MTLAAFLLSSIWLYCLGHWIGGTVCLVVLLIAGLGKTPAILFKEMFQPQGDT